MKITNTASVAILMATYNGERFIKEQIDSIIHQDFPDWNLFIQDDGSSDSTIEIIQNYQRSDHRIHVVDVGLTRQGPTMNFMSLLNIIDSDYYMFCDQDDIWLPQKISSSIDEMKKIESKDVPTLILSDKARVDSELNVILPSEFSRAGNNKTDILRVLHERVQLDMLRCICPFAGCTMFFNKSVKSIVFPFINRRYQDSIVAMAVAKNNGRFGFVLEPTMLYRLHGHNTCGISETTVAEKASHPIRVVDQLFLMYDLFRLYGGHGFFHFLYCRWRIFRTRNI